MESRNSARLSAIAVERATLQKTLAPNFLIARRCRIVPPIKTWEIRLPLSYDEAFGLFAVADTASHVIALTRVWVGSRPLPFGAEAAGVHVGSNAGETSVKHARLGDFGRRLFRHAWIRGADDVRVVAESSLV
jgi:hypothetical protein